MRAKSMIAILIIGLIAIAAPAFGDAPPWELRAYLSTYTDDADTATETWTWNYTAIRHRWACNHCGYSTSLPSAGEDCPNPWDIAGHPDEPLVAARPERRVLGYLGVEAAMRDGAATAPLVGRPFRPGGAHEPDWLASPWLLNEEMPAEDVGSYMTLRTQGLDDVVAPNDALRFLVIQPGAVRAAASFDYLVPGGEEGDPNEVSEAPAFYLTDEEGVAGTAEAEDYGIHVNPYRVSDGDEFIIRHSERRELVDDGTGNMIYVTTGLNVQVYSTLYGSDFDPEDNLDEDDLRAAYFNDQGCTVITNSGALRIEVPRQYDEEPVENGDNGENGDPENGENGGPIPDIRQNTWVLRIRIRSNTTTLPRPQEVDHGADEPDIIADINADLSAVKQPYVLADLNRTPHLSTNVVEGSTEYEVEEKPIQTNGEGTTEIWPYRMPPASAGRGRAMVQWSHRDEEPEWSVSRPDDARNVFYYTGREWHYVLDPESPDERLVTNEHVADQTEFSTQVPGLENPAYIDTYFMVSRAHPLLTGQEWARWEPGSGIVSLGPEDLDPEVASGGLPRIVIGDWNDTGYGGEYGPGSMTPSRDFYLGNRTPGALRECRVRRRGCGTIYLSEHEHDEDCPACGRTLRDGGGRLELLYDSWEPLAASPAGQSFFMPHSSLRFLPGGSTIPMGAIDYPQRLRAEIPPYQPPSVPGGADNRYENNIAADQGYRGTVVAFHRDGVGALGSNDTWDVFYLAPGSGARLLARGEADQDDAETACPTCDSRYRRDEDDCRYCATDLERESPPVPHSALTAQEFAPLGVQVSVARRIGLAADERIVDLGWVAPGAPRNVEGGEPMPSELSRLQDVRIRNEGNLSVETDMSAGPLYRTQIDPTARSEGRVEQSVPLHEDTLEVELNDDPWILWPQDGTGAMGQRAVARLRAGREDRPVAMGQPLGSYIGDAELFIDLGEDEEVAPFATTLRVVEARVPQSDFELADMEPTLVIHGDELKVLWTAQEPEDTTNIIWSEAEFDEYWRWVLSDGVPADAYNLTDSDDPVDQHSSPSVYLNPDDGTPWIAWHRAITTATGMSSAVRIANLASPGEQWQTAVDDAAKGIAGLVRPDSGGLHWLFWHSGPQGRERLRYSADFELETEPPLAPSDLRVSNAMTGTEYDFFEIELPNGEEDEAFLRYRKPAQSPFTFTKQPSVIGDYDEDGNFVLDVFFSGHIRALGNSDICWARFNFGDPGEEGFPFADIDNNFGKVAFPNVANPMADVIGDDDGHDARDMPEILDAGGNVRGYAGDRLAPSPRRQSFQARHIDWRLTYDYDTEADWYEWLTEAAEIDIAQYNDAKFYLSVVADDGEEWIYAVLWDEGSYDRSTGLYTVIPQLVRIAPGFEGLEAHFVEGIPVWHPFEDEEEGFIREINGTLARALLSPRARDDAEALGAWDDPAAAQRWPAVTLEINPASGTLTWSTMLFNPDDPEDPAAVFNEENMPGIADVMMYADYTPFIHRVTTDDANDDSPSAFFDVAGSGRLDVFWRRSYGDNDAPHFGRPTFLHRAWTRTVHLGDEGATGPTVNDLTIGDSPEWDLENGVLTVSPLAGLSPVSIGHFIEVAYTDGEGNPRTERHRVPGWTAEKPIPVNNVIGEGPLSVFPEVRSLNGVDISRFWLAWSSPREVFDPGYEGGGRIRQSTDIYTGVVVLDHGSLIPEVEILRADR